MWKVMAKQWEAPVEYWRQLGPLFETEAEAQAHLIDESIANEHWDGEVETKVVPDGWTPEAPEPEPTPELGGSDLTKFLFAGNAMFTVVSKSSGKRLTYRVSRAKGDKADRPWFVGVLTGPDNTASYRYVGCVFDQKRPALQLTKGSKVQASSDAAQVGSWLFRNLRHPEKLAQAEIVHAGRCGRCGRVLTVPESVKTGLGPECALQMM